MDDVVAADDVDLVHALQLANGPLRDDDGVLQNLRLRGDAAELAGTQHVAGVGELRRDAQAAGLRADAAVHKDDVAGLRIDLAVGQRELERDGAAGVEQVAVAALPGARDESEILLLADGEVDLERVELRDRGEHRRGPDEVADLHRGLPGDAVDERAHPGEAEVQLCGADLRLRRGDGGLVGGERLRFGVELALGDGVRLGERRVALDVDGGELDLRLGLRELALGLVERGLQRTRIDLEEHLALADLAAFAVVLADEVAGDLGLNLRVDEAIGLGDPLAGDGHVLLGGGDHLNRHRAAGSHHGGGRRGGVAAGQREDAHSRDTESCETRTQRAKTERHTGITSEKVRCRVQLDRQNSSY